MFAGGSGGVPVSISGISWATVLTDSMSDTYPRGTLVVAQKTTSDQIEVGNDIMFLTGPETSVTHRVVDVIENQGFRAFRTQGTSNSLPDSDLVHPENVIGRVIWSNEIIGAILTAIRSNWPYLLFLLACALGLKFALSRIYGKSDKKAGISRSVSDSAVLANGAFKPLYRPPLSAKRTKEGG